MDKCIISVYIFLSFLCLYQFQNKNIVLYSLLFVQLIFLIENLFYLLKKNEIKINNLVLGIIFIMLFSSIFNYETVGNYFINIILVFNVYILTKYRWNYIFTDIEGKITSDRSDTGFGDIDKEFNCQDMDEVAHDKAKLAQTLSRQSL